MTIHSGERAMWAAVLIQALRDIAGTSGDSEYHKSPALHRDRALLWSLTPDFTETCHCAGVEPSRVKAAIARLSAKDLDDEATRALYGGAAIRRASSGRRRAAQGETTRARVASLLAEGLSGAAIAKQLGMATSNIYGHITAIRASYIPEIEGESHGAIGSYGE